MVPACIYTQIFTANRELIRDPDLIYPGQIFAMPEADQTGTNRIATIPRSAGPSKDVPP